MNDEMIIWEDLKPADKLAIKALSTRNFSLFLKIWFQIIQGEKLMWNWHHSYFCHTVDEIIAGKRKSTIVNVAPGSTKTEAFSIHLAPYAYLKCRKVRNLQISQGDALSKGNSDRVIKIFSSGEWQELWPSKFGRKQIDEFQVLDDNDRVRLEMVSRSSGGQIVGKRGGYMTPGFSGLIALDDIDKPDDMFSKVKREKSHILLKNTIRSRRAKKKQGDETPILSVQQRLHAQDSTWFMMSGGMAIEFDRIVIPAMVTREYGESLPDWLRPEFERDVLSGPSVVIDGVEYWSFWEDNESIENLVALRDADLYTFLSQYQQEPIALGGNVFKSEWWRYYGDSEKAHEPRPDKFEYTFITADTAQKTNELNDYSVLCYWGKYRDRVYFIDGIRGKWEAPDLRVQAEAFIKQCWRRNKECGNLRKIYIEDKASGTGLIQDLTKAVNGMGEIVPVQRDKDKVTRAMDAQPIIKGGRVVLPDNHSFIAELVAEMSAFTYDDSHPHDDICDNVFDAANLEMNLSDDPVERMKRLAGLKKLGR